MFKPSSRPKVIKHCPEGHAMQMTWRTCPECTGQEPELISNIRGDADRTVVLAPDSPLLRDLKAAPAPEAPAPEPPPKPVVQRITVWSIVATAGAAKGQRFDLTGEERVKIGKAPKPEGFARLETIADSFMSRDHLSIDLAGTAWILHDLKSTNGTAVNGERVEEKVLAPGDEIRAGHSVFIVEVSEREIPA
jgi:hypothetical protein